jgi:hypothetical protein
MEYQLFPSHHHNSFAPQKETNVGNGTEQWNINRSHWHVTITIALQHKRRLMFAVEQNNGISTVPTPPSQQL